MSKNIGFIGAGLMGFGIAKNLIKNNFNLKVIAHNNRKPIKKLVSLGAKEVNDYKKLTKEINCLFICVTNTPVAKEIAKNICYKLQKGTFVIDITTHKENGSVSG